MNFSLESLLTAGSQAAGTGVGIIVGMALLRLLFGRLEKKEAHLDAATRGLFEGIKDQVGLLKQDCTDLRREVAQLKEQLAECERKHAISEARVMQLEAVNLGRGQLREQAAAIVAAERLIDKRKGKE